jgi:SAM-dependent methyltransferase
MKLTVKDPPRKFAIGRGEPITMRDCAAIELEADEQVTFVTATGTEYDVARKSWGYYATPSLNGRLPSFGLRAVLAKSLLGKYYVFLVEKGQEAQFERYLASEQNRVVRRLDDDRELLACERADVVPFAALPVHCMCGVDRFESIHTYFEPPPGEVRFEQSERKSYRRELLRCRACRHVVSLHGMDERALYAGEYVDATYGDAEGLRRNFERIVSLPAERSDNHGRVERVDAFCRTRFGGAEGRILDVGSGLCVFLHAMKERGWTCTALDPDHRAVRHAIENVGVNGIVGGFETAPTGEPYDVITFNKVLEHVADPIAMLSRATQRISPRGIVYIELPDADGAWSEGPAREEFFIDHLHVFTMSSTCLLAEKAGFRVLFAERIREPSSKFTIRAFLERAA